MPIVAGIDGTGPNNDAEYADEFYRGKRNIEGSFVYRICGGNADRYYRRGPNSVGWGMRAAVDDGVTFIVDKKRLYPNEPILLTGYSRGAAGAVVIAKQLKKKEINVDALLLFDCVDRQINMDASVIPNNVALVQHVIRNPAARSRMSFGNDGLRCSPPTVFPAAYSFMCTHGGMGGVPWKAEEHDKQPNDYVDEGYGEGALNWGVVGGAFYHTRVTYAQDVQVSASVWQFVQPFIKTHGFL